MANDDIKFQQVWSDCDHNIGSSMIDTCWNRMISTQSTFQFMFFPPALVDKYKLMAQLRGTKECSIYIKTNKQAKYKHIWLPNFG